MGVKSALRAIAQHIPYVIGMNKEIGDTAIPPLPLASRSHQICNWLL
ncbi:MAG: hypothetical protein PUP93_26770 [Rhizonema sp. NSF051]|nr:hypothetical protein [Rhizonema sp. NSF051]